MTLPHTLDNLRSYLRSYSEQRPAGFDNHESIGLLQAGTDSVHVQGTDAAQIDDLEGRKRTMEYVTRGQA